MSLDERKRDRETEREREREREPLERKTAQVKFKLKCYKKGEMNGKANRSLFKYLPFFFVCFSSQVKLRQASNTTLYCGFISEKPGMS